MTRSLSPMEEEAIAALRECGADDALSERLMAIINHTIEACLDLSRREIARQTLQNMRTIWLLGFICGVSVAAIVAALARATA